MKAGSSAASPGCRPFRSRDAMSAIAITPAGPRTLALDRDRLGEDDRVDDGAALVGDVDPVGEVDPAVRHRLKHHLPGLLDAVGVSGFEVRKVEPFLVH